MPSAGEIEFTLRSSTLFGGATDEELARLAELCRIDRVAADAVVLSAGDEPDDLFLLIEGELLAYVRDERGNELPLKRIAGQGSHFGEIAFLTTPRTPRSAGVRTLTECRLLRVTGESFEAWLRRERELEERLRGLAAQQIRNSASRQIPLLRTLVADGASAALKERTYGEGETICRQGETGREMYVILSGTARVFRVEPDGSIVQLARLLPGQSFGELSLMQGAPRTANVAAETELRVLSIDERDFLRLYRADPAVRQHFAALRGVYDFGHRGIAVRFVGELIGRPAFCTLFRLDDGRRVIAHRVIDHDVWSIQQADAPPDAVQVSFADPGKGAERTLAVHDGYLVGAVVKGAWPGLARIHGFVIERVALDPAQIEAFRRTGELPELLRPAAPDADPIVCQCMRVRRGTLLEAVAAGCSTVSALSERTGAGTVCGGCQPLLAELTNESLSEPVRILEVIERTAEVRSFRFAIPDAHAGHNVRPGQHLLVQATIGGVEVQRTYTLSSSVLEKRFYEITVKREPGGVMSNWLFDHGRAGSVVSILPPSGWCFFDIDEPHPLVCLVGGIGVTPALAICRSAHAAGAGRRIHVDYSVSAREHIVCGDELSKLAAEAPSMTLRVRITGEEGRLGAAEIEHLASSFPGGDFLICGSKPFQIEVQGILRRSGVPESRIHVESFDAVGNGRVRAAGETAARPERWRERVAVALSVALAAFLAQALLNWRWPLLGGVQSTTVWGALTGTGLIALYLLQWQLPYLRLSGRLGATAQAYNLHIWLGPALLGLMVLHSTRLGYRLSLVLSLCFVGSLASGAAVGALKRAASTDGARQMLLGAHIVLSCAMAGLAVAHGVMSLWY